VKERRSCNELTRGGQALEGEGGGQVRAKKGLSQGGNANLMTLQMPDCVHEKLMMKTEGMR
jgi:hypothetical protein